MVCSGRWNSGVEMFVSIRLFGRTCCVWSPPKSKNVCHPMNLRLARDDFSYLNNGFRPTLPSQTPGTFKMTDLLRWARVDPASRGQ